MAFLSTKIVLIKFVKITVHSIKSALFIYLNKSIARVLELHNKLTRQMLKYTKIEFHMLHLPYHNCQKSYDCFSDIFLKYKDSEFKNKKV